MPRELIWGELVTVRRGDLPVLAARTRRDLTALPTLDLTANPDALRDSWRDADGRELVRQLQSTHAVLRELEAGTSVLRRRHQLLAEFVEQLEPAVGEAWYVQRLAALRAELDRHPLDDPTATAGGEDGDVLDPPPPPPPPPPPTDRTHASTGDLDSDLDSDLGLDPNPAPDGDDPEELRLQLALQLTWIRDGGHVTVGVIGHDHESGRQHDVGGYHAALDWAASNRAIRKFRVARDQSHGSPE